MTSKPRGSVIYRGPSLIDGRPIVAVAITTDEPLERWQDRNAITLLAGMQETARKALETDNKR